MRDSWLLDVLKDLEDYAIKNDLAWLISDISRAYSAARKEVIGSAIIPLNTVRPTKTAQDLPRALVPVEQLNVLKFPLGNSKR